MVMDRNTVVCWEMVVKIVSGNMMVVAGLVISRLETGGLTNVLRVVLLVMARRALGQGTLGILFNVVGITLVRPLTTR